MRVLLHALIAAAALVLVYAFTFDFATAQGSKAPKNLKVMPADTPIKDVRKRMKEISKAVGLKCEKCHEQPAFEKDTPMKEKAREMMRLTESINAQLKKDGFKDKIDCVTCHAGEEHPGHSHK